MSATSSLRMQPTFAMILANAWLQSHKCIMQEPSQVSLCWWVIFVSLARVLANVYMVGGAFVSLVQSNTSLHVRSICVKFEGLLHLHLMRERIVKEISA